MFVLRRAVVVATEDGQLATIDAGTSIDDIGEHEVSQLAPDHFHEVYEDGKATGSDVVPDEWRTNEDTLAADRRQAENEAREAEERAERKAAKNAAAKEG